MKARSRNFVWLGACLAISTGGSLLAADKPPIIARAEACLRDNADRIVALEPNLESAASFLVNYACAQETSGAARYQRNVAALAAAQAMSKAIPPNKSGPDPMFEVAGDVDPDTGEFVIPEPKAGTRASPMSSMLPQMGAANAQLFPEMVPVALRKLAGDLVLAARERQAARDDGRRR